MSISDIQFWRRLLTLRAFCSLLALATTGIQAGAPAIAGDVNEGRAKSPTTAALARAPRKLSAEIDAMLWWLPEDTETILISNGKVPVGVAASAGPNNAQRTWPSGPVPTHKSPIASITIELIVLEVRPLEVVNNPFMGFAFV